MNNKNSEMGKSPKSLFPDNFEQRIERSFGMVAFISNRYLLDHMHRITQEMNMDLDTVYIWGKLAHLNIAANFPPGATPNGNLDDQGNSKSELVPVRLSDLTQITGLPRETVRRKLEKLRRMGKVERTASGAWQFTIGGVDADTRAFTRESVVRLIKAAETVLSVLDKVSIENTGHGAS